jgi:hypothetical protein
VPLQAALTQDVEAPTQLLNALCCCHSPQHSLEPQHEASLSAQEEEQGAGQLLVDADYSSQPGAEDEEENIYEYRPL